MSDSKPPDKKAARKVLDTLHRTSPSVNAARRALENSDAVRRVFENSDAVRRIFENSDAVRRALENSDAVRRIFENSDVVRRALENSDAVRRIFENSDAVRNLNTFKNLPPPPNLDAFRPPDIIKNSPPNLDAFRPPDVIKNLPPNMEAFHQELVKDGVLHPTTFKQNPIQFPKIDFEKLNVDDSYRKFIQQRVEDINKIIEVNVVLPAIIHCGSILEILLINNACKHSEEFRKAKGAPKNNKINKWTLHELIETSYTVGAIKFDSKVLSHLFIRNIRNYAHIQRQISEGYEPTNRTVKFSFQAIEAVIEDLIKFNQNNNEKHKEVL